MQNAYLQRYAQAVATMCPLPNCIGFVDGTARSICRPGIYQDAAFSGHKRTHCMKFQCVQMPYGLISEMYGPVEDKA